MVARMMVRSSDLVKRGLSTIPHHSIKHGLSSWTPESYHAFNVPSDTPVSYVVLRGGGSTTDLMLASFADRSNRSRWKSMPYAL